VEIKKYTALQAIRGFTNCGILVLAVGRWREGRAKMGIRSVTVKLLVIAFKEYLTAIRPLQDTPISYSAQPCKCLSLIYRRRK